MRDFLRRFQRKTKSLGCLRLPIFDRLLCGNAVEGVVDFRRGELLGVKRKHLRRRQIFGIKVPLPLRVLKSRGADPKVHQGSG